MNLPTDQQHMMAAMQAAIMGAREGAFDLPDGTRMIVEKPDLPGVKAVLRSQTEGGMNCIIFDPTEHRPEQFPESLPFLSGYACATGREAGGKVFATWFGLENASDQFDAMCSRSETEGWEAIPDPEEHGARLIGAQAASFQRGDLRRSIMAASFGPIGFLAVTESPAA